MGQKMVKNRQKSQLDDSNNRQKIAKNGEKIAKTVFEESVFVSANAFLCDIQFWCLPSPRGQPWDFT